MSIQDIILGTDIVHTQRIQALCQRFGAQFWQRILTPQESIYCQCTQLGNDSPKRSKRIIERLSARIATKEALAKALGTGINGLGYNQGVYWKDIEIISALQKAPEIKLYGKALEISEQQGIQRWRVSLSHDAGIAASTVLGLITK